MSLSELFKHCHDRYRQGEASDFLELEVRLRKAIAASSGLKSSLMSGDALDLENLKRSVLFSDITSVYGDTGILLGVPDKTQVSLSSRALRWIHKDVHEEPPSIELVHQFAFWDSEVFDELSPLVDRGRVVMRPLPELRVTQGGNMRRVKIEPGAIEELLIGDCEQIGQVPIKPLHKRDDLEQEVQSMFLPYLENVSTADFAKILDDEEHLLSEFRSAVKQLVVQCRVTNAKPGEVYNDVVRPSLNLVNRKFKALGQMHSLRIAGATVSTVALSLVALATEGIGANLASVLGPAGLGLIAKEYADYMKAKSELRELPMYLLWRLESLNERCQ